MTFAVADFLGRLDHPKAASQEIGPAITHPIGLQLFKAADEACREALKGSSASIINSCTNGDFSEWVAAYAAERFAEPRECFLESR